MIWKVSGLDNPGEEKKNAVSELSKKLTLVNSQVRAKFVGFWIIPPVIHLRRQKQLFWRFWTSPLNKKQTSAVYFWSCLTHRIQQLEAAKHYSNFKTVSTDLYETQSLSQEPFPNGFPEMSKNIIK